MKQIIFLLIAIIGFTLFSCNTRKPEKNYILVHGAYHGKWCWNKVIPFLEKEGHHVIAIDLPSHGDDTTSPAKVTLSSYVEKITKTVNGIDGKVILIGHSLGGVSISQFAEQQPDKIEALIYLSAVLPLNGESAFEALSIDPNPNKKIYYEISEDKKTVKVVDQIAKELFYNGCTIEDKNYGYSKLCVQPMEPFFSPVNLTSERFGRVPKYYLETLNDKGLSIEVQRLWQKRTACKAIFRLDSGHSPFFSIPEELSSVILGIH